MQFRQWSPFAGNHPLTIKISNRHYRRTENSGCRWSERLQGIQLRSSHCVLAIRSGFLQTLFAPAFVSLPEPYKLTLANEIESSDSLATGFAMLVQDFILALIILAY